MGRRFGMVYIVGNEVELFGSVYLVERLYTVSDEYMRDNGIKHKARVTLRKIKGENGLEEMDFAITNK